MSDHKYIEYGTAYIAWATANYPLTEATLLEMSSKRMGNKQILQNFDEQYSNCLVQIEAVDIVTNETLKKTVNRFRSRSHIVDFINLQYVAFLKHYSIIATFFDEVDPSIRPISKIYGKNTMLARFKSKKWYYSSEAAISAPTWGGNAAVALNDVWIALYGESLSPTPPGVWTSLEYACFWTQRNFHKKSRPITTGMVSPQAGVGRASKERSSGNITGGGGLGNSTFTVPFSLSPVMIAIGKATSYTTGLTATSPTSNPIRYYQQGKSLFIAYPVTNGTNNAVYIIPVGVDSFFVDYYDKEKYTLEAVFSKSLDNRWQSFLEITSVPRSSKEVNTAGPIEIEHLIDYVTNKKSMATEASLPSNISFRLRDKRTLKVSEISNSQITWYNSPRIGTVFPIVRKHQ